MFFFLCVKVTFGPVAVRSFCDSSLWIIFLDFWAHDYLSERPCWLDRSLRNQGSSYPTGVPGPGPWPASVPSVSTSSWQGVVSLPLSDMRGLAQDFTRCSVQARVLQMQRPWKISVHDLLTVCSCSWSFKEITFDQTKYSFPSYLNDDFIFSLYHLRFCSLTKNNFFKKLKYS